MRAKEGGLLELSVITQKAQICIWQMESKHPAKILCLVLNKLKNIHPLTVEHKVEMHTGEQPDWFRPKVHLAKSTSSNSDQK